MRAAAVEDRVCVRIAGENMGGLLSGCSESAVIKFPEIAADESEQVDRWGDVEEGGARWTEIFGVFHANPSPICPSQAQP